MAHLMPVAGRPSPASDHFRFYHVVPESNPKLSRPIQTLTSMPFCGLRSKYVDATNIYKNKQSMIPVQCDLDDYDKKLWAQPVKNYLTIEIPGAGKHPCGIQPRSKRKPFCPGTGDNNTMQPSPVEVPTPRKWAKHTFKLVCPGNEDCEKLHCTEKGGGACTARIRHAAKEFGDHWNDITLKDINVDMEEISDPRGPRTRCRYAVTSEQPKNGLLRCFPRPVCRKEVPDFRRKRSIFH